MGRERLRAVVSEEAYGVVASIVPDEPESFRSDQIAAAIRISEALRGRGRISEVVEAGDGVVVKLFLGDAPDEDFERAASELLEAASW